MISDFRRAVPRPDFIVDSVCAPTIKTPGSNHHSHHNANASRKTEIARVIDVTNSVRKHACKEDVNPSINKVDRIKINIVSKEAERIYDKHKCVVIREYQNEDILVIGCGNHFIESDFSVHEHPNAYTVDINPMINPSVQMNWHNKK